MNPLFPQLARAVAAGAAMETGREAVRRNNGGLGFNADWIGEDYFLDDFGNYYEWSWFDMGGGGGGGDWPSFDWMDWSFAPVDNSPLNNADRYGFDWGQYWRDFFDGNIEVINTAEPAALPRGFDPFPLPPLDSYRDIWPWLNDRGPGPAQLDPSAVPQQLPGYCPRGTYHPANDPYACVPFPPSDSNAKRQASAQQKAQQQAAQAARKAQQQRDRQCPKLPNGQATVFNPQTGKCEPVPQCPPGSKFDSTTRRCLTQAQVKELYGDNNWLIWALIAAGVLIIANRDSGGGRRR
jgi:hypothetical protein